jgi:hypothetical protein
MTGRPFVEGMCLLCGRTDLVVFVGPVECNGQSAPSYACAGCCGLFRQYIAAHNAERDMRPAVWLPCPAVYPVTSGWGSKPPSVALGCHGRPRTGQQVLRRP